MHTVPEGDEKRAPGALESKLQIVMAAVWALEIRLGSSGKAANCSYLLDNRAMLRHLARDSAFKPLQVCLARSYSIHWLSRKWNEEGMHSAC